MCVVTGHISLFGRTSVQPALSPVTSRNRLKGPHFGCQPQFQLLGGSPLLLYLKWKETWCNKLTPLSKGVQGISVLQANPHYHFSMASAQCSDSSGPASQNYLPDGPRSNLDWNPAGPGQDCAGSWSQQLTEELGGQDKAPQLNCQEGNTSQFQGRFRLSGTHLYGAQRLCIV